MTSAAVSDLHGAARLENQPLLELLARYDPSCQIDAAHQQTIIQFVRSHSQPFSRDHLHAHLTSSALVIDESAARVLLGYHRKLGMWLQFGGHGEPGETDPSHVALREAREESGIQALSLHPAAPTPYDLDVHQIPERPDVPTHLHLDIRFLVVAPDNAATKHQVEEQEKVQWFTWEEAAHLDLDHSLHRMIDKARTIARS